MPRRQHIDIDSYVKAVQSNPCFVCGIVDGTGVPHRVVFQDDSTIAFMNRFPTVPGYVLVCPKAHKTSVVADFTVDEYTALQGVIHRIGNAISNAVPTERLYVLSLGSHQGNAHVHWHLAPLPPGTPYEQQQFAALMFESAGGYLDYTEDEIDELATRIEAGLR